MQRPSSRPQEPVAIPRVPDGASLATRVRLGLRALNVLEDDAGDPI
ncbi:hypothetical protein [Nannocystis punicea]|uniref:Uncharacterized protein n=1 Tax=Nannocystis punicea TaxID=2995304 RepID=A0ABY7HAT4_9BACT|nr:hypothetical protein [Nannocystis poenicansa]WAS96154.1 hypothetical protein O0S08_08325 [Nannocystis poenicansa]